uniref:Uncharacterized protein n=1 Tax=viral metagenome TaxID=1070528 RepID=A0A2V0RBD0_9ZZZZ
MTATNSLNDYVERVRKWKAEEYTDASTIATGIERARSVISDLMSGVTPENVEGLTWAVGEIGTTVTEVRKAVMQCSIYQAASATEHAAMAVISDEIFTALWHLNNDLLSERLKMLDTRRMYMRRRETRNITSAAVETSFMFTMFLTNYEVLVNATSDVVRGAANWHHHMALMFDQLTAAQQYDPEMLDDGDGIFPAPLDIDNDDMPKLETIQSDETDPLTVFDDVEVTSELSDSSNGIRAQTVNEIVTELTKVKSPIDV